MARTKLGGPPICPITPENRRFVAAKDVKSLTLSFVEIFWGKGELKDKRYFLLCVEIDNTNVIKVIYFCKS